MSERKTKKNTKATSKQRLLSGFIAIILVVAAAFGLYYLTQSPETSTTTEDLKKTSLTERGGVGFAEVDIQEKEATAPGTVTDSLEKDDEVSTEPVVEVVGEAPADTDAENGGIDKPQEDLALMIANAKNYVYTIYTDLEQGSGFLFNDKGDILTNAHVAKDAAYVTVKNSNGQEFNGRVIGISETEDIALIRVPDIAGKQTLEMEMNPVEAGTKVFALGSPENIINTSTEGEIISTGNSFIDDYEYNDLYEITAQIKQGSSGGPLISAETGKILAINSIVLADNPDIGYAIPVYTVMEQLRSWADNPSPIQDEIIFPDVRDAYFSEEFLRDFLTDFYTLIPYSLSDEEITFYHFFLLPGSQAEQVGEEMVNNLKEDNRTFETVDPAITSVVINEDEAVVHANATFTFHDDIDDKIVSIRHALIYTIVIDEYGDYQISSIENQ